MIASSLVAALHFVAAFGIASTLFFEWFTFSRTPTLAEARRIALADRWYGIFAGVLLVAGFARALHFEKGWSFYAHSPFFHLKLTLFVLVGLLSIYPTLRFIRWAPALKAGRAPELGDREHTLIARLLGVQMVLLVMIVVSASLMAHAVGQ